MFSNNVRFSNNNKEKQIVKLPGAEMRFTYKFKERPVAIIPKTLLPLNSARWFGRYIINHPVYPLDAINDPVGNSAHHLVRDL